MSGLGAGLGAEVGILAKGAGAGTLLASLNGTGSLQIAERMAVANALTQGVGVMVGLQDHFSWRNVAASSVGAGIGAAVTNGLLGDVDSAGNRVYNGALQGTMSNGAQNLLVGTVAGLTGGYTAAVMQGGRVDIERVAVDAFGNALGQGLVDSSRSSSGGQQTQALWSAEKQAMLDSAISTPGGVSDSAYSMTQADRYAQNFGGQAINAGYDGQGGTSPVLDLKSASGIRLVGRDSNGIPEYTGSYSNADPLSRSDGVYQGNGVWSYPVSLDSGIVEGTLPSLATANGSVSGLDPQGLPSALLDTAKGFGNGALNLAEFIPNLFFGGALPGTPDYSPFLSGLRTQYDTPIFGSAVELVGGLGVTKIFGAIGGLSEVGANTAASVDGLNLNVRPNGTSFDGTITRLENPARVDTTFDAHAGNIAEDHRYSGPGNGAVYGATSPETAFAEVDHYGLTNGRVYASQDVNFSNVLDLTSPTVQRQLNFSLDQITGDSYFLTHQLGDFARTSGYDALLAPSARNLGGTNLVIFPKVK